MCVCVCIVLRLAVRTGGEVTKGGSSCVNPQSRRGVPTPGFVATVSLFYFWWRRSKSCVYIRRGMSCNFHQWLAGYILRGSHSFSLSSPFLHFPFYLYFFFLASSGRSWRKMLRESTAVTWSTHFAWINSIRLRPPGTQCHTAMIHHHFTNDSRHAEVIYAGAGNNEQPKKKWLKSPFFSSLPFSFFLHLFILFIVFLYIQVPSG